MMIFNRFMIFAIVINFIVVLIVLGKLSRRQDHIHNILKMIEKRITEEDHFIIKISEMVARLEKGMRAKKGEIDWEG